ncbi:MAG: chemotaxis-specific protein-glutamate methyltransferase CheB [Bacillota bacterium]
MPMNKIDVLIVDHSKAARDFLAGEIAKDPVLRVVGTASDPTEAWGKIVDLNPQVITLDVEPPFSDGSGFLKRVMREHPLPVLIISARPDKREEALKLGAVDAIDKNKMFEDPAGAAFAMELLIKLKIASIARIGRENIDSNACAVESESAKDRRSKKIVAIGASTGGTDAISTILTPLKKDVPGIVVVQHMPPVFTLQYARRLNNSCEIEVKEAEDGDLVLSGRALIAPGGYHMRVEKDREGYRVTCKKGAKVNGHCPSVDVLFESVEKAAKKNALGILLTGMGSDGAKGLLAMRNSGAATIGQSPESCTVYGMPMAAMELGAVQQELPLMEIVSAIEQWGCGKPFRK